MLLDPRVDLVPSVVEPHLEGLRLERHVVSAAYVHVFTRNGRSWNGSASQTSRGVDRRARPTCASTMTSAPGRSASGPRPPRLRRQHVAQLLGPAGAGVVAALAQAPDQPGAADGGPVLPLGEDDEDVIVLHRGRHPGHPGQAVLPATGGRRDEEGLEPGEDRGQSPGPSAALGEDDARQPPRPVRERSHAMASESAGPACRERASSGSPSDPKCIRSARTTSRPTHRGVVHPASRGPG